MTDHEAPDPTSYKIALQRITHAKDAVQLAKGRNSHQSEALTVAQENLREVVLAARDGGISWQAIGEVLGMNRGNAYQQFRRRPDVN